MAIQTQSRTTDHILSARLAALSRGGSLLAVIDGDPRSKGVVDHLIGMGRQELAGDSVLLNLQPRPAEIRTRAIMADKVRQHLMARGHAVLAQAEQALTEAGLNCRSRVEIGDDAETIVRCAKEERCDLIVMAAPRAAGFHRRLLKATGIAICSRAGQVAELSELSVLILKPRVP